MVPEDDSPVMVSLPDDPTARTISALDHEIKLLQQQIDYRFDRAREGMDLRLTNLKELHTYDTNAIREVLGEKEKSLDAKTKCVEEIVNEKLTAIQDYLKAQEDRRKEQKQDDKDKLLAALTSSKEIVQLQNAFMKDQLTQLGTTYTVAHAALVELVSEAKNHITTLEAMRMSGDKIKDSTYVIIGLMISLALLASSLHIFGH